MFKNLITPTQRHWLFKALNTSMLSAFLLLLSPFTQGCSAPEAFKSADSLSSTESPNLPNSTPPAEAENLDCYQDKSSVAHDTNKIFYSEGTGDCGRYEARRCTNGTLSGSLQYSTCNRTRTAYPSSTVESGQTCSKTTTQESLCSDGICQGWAPSSYSQTCQVQPYLPKLYLYIMSGQSNMEGIAPFTKDIKNLYSTRVPANVEYYNWSKRITDFSQNTDYNKDGIVEIGPEISFIHEISRTYPKDRILVIKVAVSGSSLKNWLPTYLHNSGQMMTNSNAIFPMAESTLNTILSGRSFIPKSILWMQGESDALGYNEFGRQYRYNFSKLINSFRNYFNSPSLPFIFGKILNFNEVRNTLPAGSVAGIRSAQVAVAASDTNAHIITIDNFQLSDVWHFNGISQMSFGKCLHSMSLSPLSSYTCPVLVNPPSQVLCIFNKDYPCENINIQDEFLLYIHDVYTSHFGAERRCLATIEAKYWSERNLVVSRATMRNEILATSPTNWNCP